MLKILQDLCDLLTQGQDAVLAAICRHGGSTPRTSGARMLVRPDGSISGSVGGGLVEAATMRQAQTLFSQGPDAALYLPFELSGADAASLDMICGGSLGLILARVAPGPESLDLFSRALAGLRAGRTVTILTDLEPAGDSQTLRVNARHLMDQDTLFPPAADLTNALSDLARTAPETRLAEVQGRTFLVEPLTCPGTVVLAGGGHVAQQTAILAAFAGFHVAVLDDRPEFANADRFPQAGRIAVTPDYTDCFARITTDENSYIVIVTRGHVHDKTVLAQALRAKSAYVGMIGSLRKREAIYAALAAEGFTPEDLARVHSPIGLPIGADTPEEIAVSIVAELIQVRAARRRHGL